MALLPVALVLVLAAAVAVGAGSTRRVPPSAEATVSAARRHASRTAVAAVVLGAAAALAGGTAGPFSPGGPAHLGVTALLVPVTFGVVHTAVLALGELTWPQPHGQIRRARLVHRGLLAAAPRWLTRLGGWATVVTVVTLSLGAALAADDGRSLSLHTADGRLTATAGPFPGPVYGLPAAVGLLLLAALTVVTLRIVATRAAVVTTDERIEAALRRASAHRVLRGAAGTCLVVTGGLLLVAGMATRDAAYSTGLEAVGVRAPTVPADHAVAA